MSGAEEKHEGTVPNAEQTFDGTICLMLNTTRNRMSDAEQMHKSPNMSRGGQKHNTSECV